LDKAYYNASPATQNQVKDVNYWMEKTTTTNKARRGCLKLSVETRRDSCIYVYSRLENIYGSSG
jgi:hypothetical protein